MTTVLVEKSFHEAFGRFESAERARIGDFMLKFLADPSHPSLQAERVDQTRNKDLWAARVTQDLRAIYHKAGGQYVLLWVDKHDKAYAWARPRRLETNARTGELQLITVPEVTPASVPAPAGPATPYAKGLFDDASDDYLLSLGVPPDFLPAVRHVRTDEQLGSLSKNLPEELSERLYLLACGEVVTPPRPVPAGTAPTETAEGRRRYWTIHEASEIEELRDKPIEAWMRYLHPSQRSLVEATFSGPAKVTGAAGTGKTVVAMHRARELARRGKRVLLTSFVTTLCRNLDRSLRVLCSDEERGRIDVKTVDAAAAAIHKEARTGARFAKDEDVERAIARNASYAAGVGDAGFLLSEWQQVVDAQALQSWDEYREANRRGRGRALGVAERKKAWDCFSRVLSQLEAAGELPHSVWLRRAEEIVRSGKVGQRWDAVVVDEVQDLSPAALRFLAALAAADLGSFLLVGDGGQRIYRTAASLRTVGIEVRGRSRVLKLNYRNTRQIQAAADVLLSGGADDLDEGSDERKGTLSPLGGPEPVFRGFPDRSSMLDHVVSEVKGLLLGGLAPKEVGVFARRKDVVTAAAEALKSAGIPSEALDADTDLANVRGVNVGTMHRAKGLEFKAVFVVGAQEGVIPPASVVAKTKDPVDREALLVRERNLLYVALTRARDEAWVLWTGKPCQFLAPVLGAGKESPS